MAKFQEYWHWCFVSPVAPRIDLKFRQYRKWLLRKQIFKMYRCMHTCTDSYVHVCLDLDIRYLYLYMIYYICVNVCICSLIDSDSKSHWEMIPGLSGHTTLEKEKTNPWNSFHMFVFSTRFSFW
jgi:hypothetical protein